jgi:hypothetical protein
VGEGFGRYPGLGMRGEGRDVMRVRKIEGESEGEKVSER